jgi:hypothetical protein
MPQIKSISDTAPTIAGTLKPYDSHTKYDKHQPYYFAYTTDKATIKEVEEESD